MVEKFDNFQLFSHVSCWGSGKPPPFAWSNMSLPDRCSLKVCTSLMQRCSWVFRCALDLSSAWASLFYVGLTCEECLSMPLAVSLCAIFIHVQWIFMKIFTVIIIILYRSSSCTFASLTAPFLQRNCLSFVDPWCGNNAETALESPPVFVSWMRMLMAHLFMAA